MPKRTDINAILVIGAGPIIIGQACEFDYSGTQAVKTLKSLGYRVILANSNPATIMTDPSIADATYVEPLTAQYMEMIIAKECPDAILPTMGGQTALNVAIELSESGVLARYGVELIGADAEVIDKAEDRSKFRSIAQSIGLDVPRAFLVHTYQEAMDVKNKLSFPIVLRPSYTLAGSGGGIAYNERDFNTMIADGLAMSPVSQVLLEESVIGWKEFEIEVVRDKNDNCIVVCSIENIDPMGVHTGDSITVAPILTLTDKEYQAMRDASFAIVRAIGVETGGCNVQFAVNPRTGDMVVIEVNPRVSRSSALASKATGFPIAKVAAQLAVGFTLDEITNEITTTTPASFEPTLDYIVVKIPRFDFQKFQNIPRVLNTSMKSVGETMAVARTFKEALQKALCSLENGLTGLDAPKNAKEHDHDSLRAKISIPSDDRLLWVGQAMRAGFSIDDIYGACAIDPWFLREIRDIITTEKDLQRSGLPSAEDRFLWSKIKVDGFTDQKIADLTGAPLNHVVSTRKRAGVMPVFKRIDTCAAEFDSKTPYLYSSYEWSVFSRQLHNDAPPSDHPRKVVVLGSGPNRIGQGIEFDYCCVHAISELRNQGCEAIMVNCNPETVSTDYDIADRLYFEPLIFERVIEVLRYESQCGNILGVLVQFGGQTPLKLAKEISGAGFRILGTSIDSIDISEDRKRFFEILQELDIAQPRSGTAVNCDEAKRIAETLGYPLLVRPSYVLGGRAMEVVHTQERLERAFAKAWESSAPNPVLIDQFLPNAIEFDVDVVADGKDVIIGGIIEHVEQAGIHSGDSAGVLPTLSLGQDVISQIHRHTKALALKLNVIGLINIQYAVRDHKPYILEANLRASRTVPFVAKATGVEIAKLAVQAIMGRPLGAADIEQKIRRSSRYYAVKEAVFPFVKLQCSDALLGPEMQSTGEVIGIDKTYAGAFAKAQIAAGLVPPTSGAVLLSVCDSDKEACCVLAQNLIQAGFSLIATNGTAQYLKNKGINRVKVLNKVVEGSPHCVDAILNEDVQLVINTTSGSQSIQDSASIRMSALTMRIPYTTTMAGAVSMVRAVRALRDNNIEIASLQEYHKD